MATVHYDLPDADLGWVRSRVEAGEAPSIEAFLRDLARRARKQAEETAWLDAELAKGEASGTDPRSSDEIFHDLFQKHFGVDG